MEPVNMIWLGATIPADRLARINSFLALSVPINLWCWPAPYMPGNVPAGVTVCDGTQIRPTSEVYFTQQGHWGVKSDSPANFTDMARMILLEKIGGWYSDTDNTLLQAPLEAITPDEIAIACDPSTRSGIIAADVYLLRFPPGHKMLKSLIQDCKEWEANAPMQTVNGVPYRNRLRYGDFGKLFRRAVRQFDLGKYMVPPSVMVNYIQHAGLTMHAIQ